MATVSKTVTIDFDNPRQRALCDWLAKLPESARKLPPLSITVSTTVGIEAFGDDEIEDRYNEIFADADKPSDIARLYRLIAAGENAEAMQLLHDEFPGELAPPVT